MGTRTLDWLDLCDIALRKDIADRLITVAGLPAAVKKSRGTDVGFVVQAHGEEYAVDDYWELRTQRELILLRHLVTAGQVEVEVPDEASAEAPEPDDGMDTVEVTTYGGELARVYRFCRICGANETTPHDGAAHDAYVADRPAHTFRED